MISSSVFTQVTTERPYTLLWEPLSPKLPIPIGIWTPSNTTPWAIRAHKPNGISIGSAVFAQVTAECLDTLQRDAPFPLKIGPSHGGIWTSI